MLFGALLQRWEEEAETVLYFQTHDKNLHCDSNYTVGIKQYVNIINMHFIAAREKCPISAEGIRETGLETVTLSAMQFLLADHGVFLKILSSFCVEAGDPQCGASCVSKSNIWKWNTFQDDVPPDQGRMAK